MSGVERSETDERVPTRFGALLKELRRRRNLSQDRLGELAGINGSYVSQIEKGDRGKRPGRDVVIGLAQALREPAQVLLEAAGLEDPTVDLRHRPSFEDFVSTDPDLRSDQKRALVAMYRTYVPKGSSTG